MANYSRKRYKLIKGNKKYQNTILFLFNGHDKYWTYDEDSYKAANLLGGWVYHTTKGAGLVLDSGDFSDGDLHAIPGEEDAFLFQPAPVPAFTPSLPASALVSVTLSSEKETRECIIVSDYKEQQSSKHIYWAGRHDYQLILFAVAKGLDTVSLGTQPHLTDCSIQNIKKTAAFDPYVANLLHFHFCESTESPKTIYICKSVVFTDMEPVTALFFVAGETRIAAMSVYYSPKDGNYYLNKETYDSFRDKYGLPYVHLEVSPFERDISFKNLAEESKLHLYGYSVSQKIGLSQKQRQDLLAQLINSKLMTKGKIQNHLSWLIHQNKNNPTMIVAIERWTNDNKFVNGYNMNDQSTIWAKAFIAKK